MEARNDFAKLYYEQLQRSKDRAFQLQGDYGKWLVASLLLIHGATIAFLAQNERLASAVLPLVFWCHVIGLLLALICGFVTWVNWSLHASAYEEVTPYMLDGTMDNWPKFEARDFFWIKPTFWIAIVAGLGSAACILVSAIVIYSKTMVQ